VAGKIVIVAGPTATGKTGAAISLAKKHGAEVVSADSMQVYRGLDIGTAKPDLEERQGIPHHLIDVADPDEPFDTERYIRTADETIADIHGRGKRVIVAGGTGLYLRALLHGLQEGPKPDPALREELIIRAEKEGWPRLHRELEAVDPETAERLHPNDGVRIVRALEVVLASGVPMSTWHREHRFRPRRYEALFLVLNRPRADLVARIHRRADQMMEQGFLEEVRGLFAKGFGAELKPMQGLGYPACVNT